MQTYRKKDVLTIPSREEFVKKLRIFSNRHLAHNFTLTEEQISNVLTALSYYCEEKGKEAVRKVYNQTSLRMVQYEDGGVGHRFENWCM